MINTHIPSWRLNTDIMADIKKKKLMRKLNKPYTNKKICITVISNKKMKNK